MGDELVQDLGYALAIICAVSLEQWTPTPRPDAHVTELPPHRMMYDARTDELRVEWYSVSTRDWRRCECADDSHLPILQSAFRTRPSPPSSPHGIEDNG